jgi:hypothetical protein
MSLDLMASFIGFDLGLTPFSHDSVARLGLDSEALF